MLRPVQHLQLQKEVLQRVTNSNEEEFLGKQIREDRVFLDAFQVDLGGHTCVPRTEWKSDNDHTDCQCQSKSNKLTSDHAVDRF